MTGQRRLAAILAADVVGFSRLAGGDEQGTLARLNELRRSVIDPQVGQHGGRLFKAMGDGFLVEFASPVQALACARAIQDANASGALSLRIGLHLGDVVVEGDDLMGDGVNIAVRLEGIADPGGISLSRQIHDQVHGKVPVDFEDRGEIELKNLVRPVHVFRVAGARTAAAGPALALPDKPSIAVLPFQNMSDDPEQEYFSDGLTEDIITALSKWHWFFVIARNSSFTYKGRAVDVKVVGRELGARYVLEGSVRKSGGTVRVTAQLIESQNGAHIWAQRYDRDMADIFVVQDEITSQIARALDVELIEAENTRRARERPSHPEATDLVLRARALQNDIRGRSHAQILATRQLLLEALALDDTAPNLHAELARTYLNEAVYGWAEDYADTVQHASDAADRGILLYPREASAYVSKGMAHRLRGDVEKAMGSFRIALDLNPNYANAQTQVADTLTQMGRPEVGYEAAKVALRLDPRYPNSYRYIGRACFHMDRFAEAAEWLQQALQLAPNTWFVQAFLAASLVYSDRLEEAERMVAEMTRTSPIASIGKLRALELPGAPNWMKHLAMMNEALRRAGLPE